MDQEASHQGRIEEELEALRERILDLEQITTESLEFRQTPQDDGDRYRRLFQHSPGAYSLLATVTDELGEAVDLEFVEVNTAFEQLLGRPAEDILGGRLSQVISRQDTDSLIQILVPVGEGHGPIRFEHFSPALAKHLDISSFSPRLGQVATFVSDVTHRKRTEETLRLRTAYFKQLFESSPLGIVLLDNDDRVVECNQGFEQLFGFLREEARGRPISTLIVSDDQFTDASVLTEKVLRGELVDAEGVRYRKDGTPVDVRILAHPIHLDDEQIGIYGIYSDISRRKRDSLTRLVNRSTFMERLDVELDRAVREEKLTAVLTLDLDQLKDVNDTYGLEVGDAVLQSVANRLRDTLRPGASIARLGGDEFGLLQVDLSDVGNAVGLARRLLAALEQPFEIESHRIHVRASAGIAIAPPGSVRGPQQLVAQAERALAEAKLEGGGRFKFHAAHMDREVQSRMLLGQELHGAIDRQELYLEYQPQIAMPDLRMVGVEALLRWRHPSGRPVGPDRFVPVAEASGAIVPIGDWVLRTACAQAVEWQLVAASPLPVAVNLSAVQFKDPGFADSVMDALNETGLPPELLELELTERILIEATEGVLGTLNRLQESGVRLALDDFGKGYSSLEYIRTLPLQKLKIDRSFVRNLDGDSSNAAIVGAITGLGRRLGLTVLAEGVERQSQLDLLAAEGCQEMQGFFFSPPVGPDRVTRMMYEGDGLIVPSGLAN